MKSIDLIRWAMQMTEHGTNAIVDGLRDSPLARATPGARGGDGNHAIWLLGHLCFVEGSLPKIVRGEAHPVEHWMPLFGTGTRSLNDASKFPSFDQVLAKFRELRGRNLALLDELGPDALDRAPAWVPPGFEDAMKTVGQTFLLIALHNMVHYGQLADVRRVAGLQPLF